MRINITTHHLAILVVLVAFIYASSNMHAEVQKTENIKVKKIGGVMSPEINKKYSIQETQRVAEYIVLTINENSTYTNSSEVILNLKYAGIERCRLKNDEDSEWGEWQKPQNIINWSLSDEKNGMHIVIAECEGNKTQQIIWDEIILDKNPPIVAYRTSLKNTTLLVKDNFTQQITCNINGNETIVENGKTIFLNYKIEKITCRDEAGNSITVNTH